jgi:hypothetical protein
MRREVEGKGRSRREVGALSGAISGAAALLLLGALYVHITGSPETYLERERPPEPKVAKPPPGMEDSPQAREAMKALGHAQKAVDEMVKVKMDLGFMICVPLVLLGVSLDFKNAQAAAGLEPG